MLNNRNHITHAGLYRLGGALDLVGTKSFGDVFERSKKHREHTYTHKHTVMNQLIGLRIDEAPPTNHSFGHSLEGARALQLHYEYNKGENYRLQRMSHV